MNKLIATGTIVDNEKVTIAASVYEEIPGEESNSGDEAGTHYVTNMMLMLCLLLLLPLLISPVKYQVKV